MQNLVQKSAIFNISASYSVTYNAYMSGFDIFLMQNLPNNRYMVCFVVFNGRILTNYNL